MSLMVGVVTATREELLSVPVLTPDLRVVLMATLPWAPIEEVWTFEVRWNPIADHYRGKGQAQYIRVPYADFNALLLPPGTQHEADFVLLAGKSSILPKPASTDRIDIFPTGWHGVEISGFKSGESIAVFGAGPVGLMAAYSAQLRGASRVFVVDRVPERLAVSKKIGCIPIDFTQGDAVDQIINLNDGMVDRSVDAVGYQAVNSTGSAEKPNIVLENMIRVTRACGGMGIPGLYVPRFVILINPAFLGCDLILTLSCSDPGASDDTAAQGLVSLSFGKLFEKASFHSGFDSSES